MDAGSTNWLSGMRGMALILVLWVVGWGFGFGGLTELLLDPDGEVMDVWPVELAIPGFVGGVVFAALLVFAERRRSFDEVPFPRFALWGVVTGLAVGVFAMATGFGSAALEGLLLIAQDRRGEEMTNDVFSMDAAQLLGITAGLEVVAAIGSGVFLRLVVLARGPMVAGRTG